MVGAGEGGGGASLYLPTYKIMSENIVTLESYNFVSFQQITFKLGNFINFKGLIPVVSTDFPQLDRLSVWGKK